MIRQDESWISRNLNVVYYGVQGAILIVSLVASYLCSNVFQSTQHGQWDQKPALFVASLYFSLATIGAYYSWKSV